MNPRFQTLFRDSTTRCIRYWFVRFTHIGKIVARFTHTKKRLCVSRIGAFSRFCNVSNAHCIKNTQEEEMRIVCISDTHNLHRKLQIPDGDVLVHAGDFTLFGKQEHLNDFNEWLGTLPHRHKLVVQGNHDCKHSYFLAVRLCARSALLRVCTTTERAQRTLCED